MSQNESKTMMHEGVDSNNDESGDTSPLSRFPSARFAIPAVSFLIACGIATVCFSTEGKGEYLHCSGDAIMRRHEYWRLVTALLVHGDIGHLLSNIPLIAFFGWLLRAYFGRIAFPVVSIAVGAAANLASVLFYPPHVSLIGASGMGYGMAAIWIVCYLRHDTRYSISIRFLRVAGFSLVLLVPSVMEPHVSYIAHAFGFIFGIGAGCGLILFVPPRVPA